MSLHRGLALILPLFLAAPAARAADILKVNKKAVLVQFDPLEENFVTGDRLIASLGGKKSALLEITRVKGARFLARVLYGRAATGMTLAKFGVVTDLKPTVNAPNVENVTLRFASSYIYRGVPQGATYVAGALDVVNEGLLAGANISNAVAPATSEFDAYLGYAINRINWTLTPMVAHYSFPGASGWDCWDFMVTFTYDVFALDVSYMPRYYDAKSSDTYVRLSTAAGLGERWKINLAAGRSWFGEESRVGYESYFDYKVGFLYSTPEFAAEFAWTDTYRRDLGGRTLPDGTAAVLISKRF